ncbi:DUF485 domain-containing protein [Virgibacillus salexigens]|uniref:Membrane protein n=1 Tax=Virgibacillus kapii TaxID=1638645 RepID=A0ABQ2DNN6_9BACI|nr:MULTISPECIES: DUF485 domain-containing protein [Virgibacillus]MYL40162.1 DUF485 domain-containing protein [Virgibacillus massiliensis]GGJ61129.1 membrane protein [Virgibacillus kapii]
MSFGSDYKELSYQETKPDYQQVAESASFKDLITRRKRFIIPLTIFFLVFYFLLPVLTSYTTFLNTPAIGDISWAWLFAFAQFIMTWVFCIIYVKKSAQFDRQSDEIIEDQLGGERE